MPAAIAVPAIIEGASAIGSAIVGHKAASDAAKTQTTAAQTAGAQLTPYAQGGQQAFQKQLAMYGITLPQPNTATAPGGAPAGPIVDPRTPPPYGMTSTPQAAPPQGYSLASLAPPPVTQAPPTRSSYGIPR